MSPSKSKRKQKEAARTTVAQDGGHRETGWMSTEPADKEDGKGLATSEDNGGGAAQT